MRIGARARRVEHSPAPPLQRYGYNEERHIFISPPPEREEASSPPLHRALDWSPVVSGAASSTSFTAGRRAVLLHDEAAAQRSDDRVMHQTNNNISASYTSSSIQSHDGEDHHGASHSPCRNGTQVNPFSCLNGAAWGREEETKRCRDSKERFTHHERNVEHSPCNEVHKGIAETVTASKSGDHVVPDYNGLVSSIDALRGAVLQLCDEFRQLRHAITSTTTVSAPTSNETKSKQDMHVTQSHPVRASIHADVSMLIPTISTTTVETAHAATKAHVNACASPVAHSGLGWGVLESDAILTAMSEGLHQLDALPSFLPPGHRAALEAARRQSANGMTNHYVNGMK